MSEFKASDPEVRDIAAVFALKGWQWTTKNGQQVPPFVPKASDIARSLDNLYSHATMATAGCFCDPSNDGECDHEPPNSGSAESGRLFVSWIDEGYGHEVKFGIIYGRTPTFLVRGE